MRVEVSPEKNRVHCRSCSPWFLPFVELTVDYTVLNGVWWWCTNQHALCHSESKIPELAAKNQKQVPRTLAVCTSCSVEWPQLRKCSRSPKASMVVSWFGTASVHMDQNSSASLKNDGFWLRSRTSACGLNRAAETTTLSSQRRTLKKRSCEEATNTPNVKLRVLGADGRAQCSCTRGDTGSFSSANPIFSFCFSTLLTCFK